MGGSPRIASAGCGCCAAVANVIAPLRHKHRRIGTTLRGRRASARERAYQPKLLARCSWGSCAPASPIYLFLCSARMRAGRWFKRLTRANRPRLKQIRKGCSCASLALRWPRLLCSGSKVMKLPHTTAPAIAQRLAACCASTFFCTVAVTAASAAAAAAASAAPCCCCCCCCCSHHQMHLHLGC